MATNHEETIEVEENLELPQEVEEGQEDTTDWKAEAKKLQEKAIKQREKTKELKAKVKELTPAEKKAEANTEKKSGDLDSGQLALLRTDGIKGKEEIALVKEYLASGKDLLDIMENKHFLNDLSDLREAKATMEATPTGTNRTAGSSKNTVEYWSEKYSNGTSLLEVPQQFRDKVLDARVTKEKDSSMFSDTPIIGA